MVRLLLSLEDAASKALLCVIVVLVFVAGVARTLGMPLVWSVDLAQLLFVWLCFLGANRALRVKAHIGVDYFVGRLPHGLRRGVELLLGAAALAFLVALAWTGARLTLLNWERVYGDSGFSYAWVTGAVPVGCALLALTLAVHMLRALTGTGLVFAPERGAAGQGERP